MNDAPETATLAASVLPVDANAALQYGALGILMVVLVLFFFFGNKLAGRIVDAVKDVGDRMAKSIDRSTDRMDQLIATLNNDAVIGERRHAETRLDFDQKLQATRHGLRDDIQKFCGGIEISIDRLRVSSEDRMRGLEDRLRAIEKAK